MECIASLTPDGCADPYAGISSPPPLASVVELRLDLFDELDVHRAVRQCPLPVLATLRSSAEGGRGTTDPKLRQECIQSAYEAGAALIDLEYERDLGLMTKLGLEPERVILSWHDTSGTPTDLEMRAASMLSCAARWVKIIPTASNLQDALSVLQLVRKHAGNRPASSRLIAFAMNLEGQFTRYLAPLLGSPLVFTAWGEDAAAAPGQVTASALDAAVGHLNGAPQRFFAVLGSDVSRSLSPALHGAAYQSLGLPYALLPISLHDSAEIDLLAKPRGMTALDEIGISSYGFAVTSPFKKEAADIASIQAPRVARADAANTLILTSDSVVAENTDADGVVGSLMSRGIDPSGRTVLIQGTGGAARGAAVGLDLAGAHVVLRGRDRERTRTCAHLIGVDSCGPEETPEDTSILVNATPLGSHESDTSPFESLLIDAADAVLDMVYGAHSTELEGRAAAVDTSFIGGREMLLYQGIAQFGAFTGRQAPREAMAKALEISL